MPNPNHWSHELHQEPDGTYRLEVLDERGERVPVARQITESQAKLSSGAVGDAHQRQLKYASILADYHLVVRTVGGRRFSRCWGAGFTAHATASPNRATFPIDAFRLGGRLHRAIRFDLLSTEDPMLCGLAGYLLKRRFGLPLSVQLAGDMLDNPYWLRDRRLNPLFNLLGKWLV